jgi:putative endopeptidase
MKIYTLILALFASIIIFSCGKEDKPAKADALSANLDTQVSPGDDFFQYATGTWLKNNPIPDEESSWGIGNVVQTEIYHRLRTVNEQAVKSNSTDNEKKIANFWTAGMDTVNIEKQGLAPLKSIFTSVDNVKDVKGLVTLAAELKSNGVNTLFSDNVGQDDKNSEVMAYFLYQGGLGLPNRDYYFNKDERTSNIVSKYKIHITNMLKLYGYDSVKAKQRAEKIFAIETSLAKSSRKLEALRDPYANYNKMAIADLSKRYKMLPWDLWFSTTKVSGIDSVIVGQPEFFAGLNDLVKKTPMTDFQDYLRFHILRSYSPYLSQGFVNENFDFYRRTLRGTKKLKPRWKRVLDAEEQAMGELLGQLFVKEYFNETAKKRYDDLVESIRTSLKERIAQLEWMNDSTKTKAYEKLASIKKKVGYPDKWKDFSGLQTTPDSYASNIMAARQWWRKYEFNKLGKPVDRDEWGMSPQTYNAYYNPSNNEIVLPAGIFTVPGYRDEELDDALVYGYAGASTIGHEIIHGFDDQGRQYDAKGNLKDWWTKDDQEKFIARSKMMVKQFNEFIPVDTLHINGEATLGENIADLGGIQLGWHAFKKTEQYKSGKEIGGLTPGKRFFLGYTLGWVGDERKETLANQLLTDVHSPAKYRVNGPFVSVEDFYTEFGIKEGDKMFRADSVRVKIW